MSRVDSNTNNQDAIRRATTNKVSRRKAVGVRMEPFMATKRKAVAVRMEPSKAPGTNINVDSGSGDDQNNIMVGNPYENIGKNNDQGNANAQGQGIVEGEMDMDSQITNPTQKAPINVNTGSGDDTVIINGPVNGPVNVDSGSGDDSVVIGPGPAPEPVPLPATPEEPIAANENGRIWGDPHFEGGDGGKFDVQGEAGKNYNLLSDTGLEFNGRFDGWSDGATVVGETGLTVKSEDGAGSSVVGFQADGTATLDGEKMEPGKLYSLADGGTAKLEGNILTTITAEGYTVKQTSNGSGDRAFINVDVNTGANGVGNGQNPGGLLGHTFDADDAARNGTGSQGEGAIDGNVQDYEVGSLIGDTSVAGQDEQQSQVPGGPIDVGPGGGVQDGQQPQVPDGPINVDSGSGDDVVVIGPGQPNEGPGSEPTPEQAPVAANEEGRIEGDPHFYGADGGAYDIQGEPGKIYNLLDDTGLELRGRFDSWGGNGATVVGETGLTVGEGMNSDNINFRKDGTAQINGQLMEEGQEYELADGGTAKLENGELTVITAEGYTIKQTTHTGDQGNYINMSVSSGENGVDGGQMPGGLLGQTFDADNEARNGKTGSGAQGEGAITGDVNDYERPALDPVNDTRGAEETATDDIDTAELMQKLEDLINMFMDNQSSTSNQSPPMETYTNAGSGDDEVEILTGGNHIVDLGSGDDQAFVDFEDGKSGNSAVITGGSGEDTVTLAGSQEDYTVSYERGYDVYTDQDGNSVRVGDDVEKVLFEEEPVMQPAVADEPGDTVTLQ